MTAFRSLLRSLDVYSFASGALVAVTLVAFAVWCFAPAEASPRRPKVTYIRCGPGDVHVWLYGESGIAVMPAGTDCSK